MVYASQFFKSLMNPAHVYLAARKEVSNTISWGSMPTRFRAMQGKVIFPMLLESFQGSQLEVLLTRVPANGVYFTCAITSFRYKRWKNMASYRMLVLLEGDRRCRGRDFG